MNMLTYVYGCTHIRTHITTQVYIYIHVYTYIYIHTHAYTNIFIERKRERQFRWVNGTVLWVP